MTLNEIAELMQRGLNKNRLDETIKFDCGDDGVISLIDSKALLEDRDADCTIRISLKNLGKLVTGKMNPMTGFAMGKIKVSGDMALAMKLGQLIG